MFSFEYTAQKTNRSDSYLEEFRDESFVRQRNINLFPCQAFDFEYLPLFILSYCLYILPALMSGFCKSTKQNDFFLLPIVKLRPSV